MVEGKKMTASKNGKVTSSKDAINESLVKDFSSILNLEAEINFFEKAVSMLNNGAISVRGLKATIEKAEEVGTAPTIRTSQVQYFVDSADVRKLDGAKSQSLKAILNATIQAKRAYKKDFSAKLAEASTFAQFVRAIPSQGERAKAGRKASEGETLANLDAYISLFMGAKDLDDLSITNEAQFDEFCKFVTALVKAHKANHPSVKAQRVAA
jgi:hypothetical protein